MAELTQQHLDKIEKTAVLVANLVVSMQAVPATLNNIQETLNSHTGSLDGIAKNTKDLSEKMIVAEEKMKIQDSAIKFIAEKVGVKEEVEKITQS